MDTWDWTPLIAGDGEDAESVRVRWHASGAVDGLPIVPPTPTRIRACYRGAALDPTRVLGVLEPSASVATVYDAAICTVAAGGDAAHLPWVAAALAAMTDPAFNLLGIQSTTGTATAIVLAHGPGVARAGISGGADCLSGGVRANACIGRAVRIALRTAGGARPGGMDAATMGQPAKLGLCFAENLDRSPWPSLHVERGLTPVTDAVTVVGVSGSVEIVAPESEDAGEILVTVAGSMTYPGNAGGSGLAGGGSPLLVLSYEHATALAVLGLDRAAVQRELWRLARLPLASLARSSAERIRRSRTLAGANPDAPLLVAQTPADILVAVAGGVGIKSTYFPSWGGGTRAITRALL